MPHWETYTIEFFARQFFLIFRYLQKASSYSRRIASWRSSLRPQLRPKKMIHFFRILLLTRDIYSLLLSLLGRGVFQLRASEPGRFLRHLLDYSEYLIRRVEREFVQLLSRGSFNVRGRMTSVFWWHIRAPET